MLVLKRLGAVVCLTIGLSYSSVSAQEQKQNKLGYGMENDFISLSLWRGMVVDDRPVMETSAWIGHSGLSLNAWGNLALSAGAGRTQLRVSGLTLGYSRKWKSLTIEPAIEAYRLPKYRGMEGSLRLKYKVGPIHAFTEHAVEILDDKGAYFGEAGLGYERHITKKTRWQLN